MKSKARRFKPVTKARPFRPLSTTRPLSRQKGAVVRDVTKEKKIG